MVIKPLAERRKPKPAALILGTGPGYVRLVDDQGEVVEAHARADCAELLAAYSSHQVYTATKATELLRTTGARCWSGYQWRGGLVRVQLDAGPTIYPIRRALRGLADPGPALFATLRWLGGLGVVPGGLGSMAWRLWRATLAGPVDLRGPQLRDALYGGRQEAPMPGDYAQARSWDLGAAYPHSMAAEPYPSRLIPVAPQGLSLAGCGIARAEVDIPPMEWCPLPVRVGTGALCYGWGKAEGWWPWRELRQARDAGCRVVVREAWAGMGDIDLFGAWWQLVQQGRRLRTPGAAGVVKAITSSLWGQFAIEGEGGRRVRWLDDAGRQAVAVDWSADHQLPQARTVHIAAETTARVRGRLWAEGLALPSAIYCDTDGVICGAADRPAKHGRTPGLWSLRATMAHLDLRGPQVYRWLCPTCHNAGADDHAPWHHVVAGAPTPAIAAAVFARAGSRSNVASLAPGEVTLPAGPLARFQNGGVAA